MRVPLRVHVHVCDISRSFARVALLTLLALPVLAVTARLARAQSPGDSIVPVTGFVRGADGLGIANAEVSITPKSTPGAPITLGRRIFTDDSGSFKLTGVPSGAATIVVRRIGYTPITLETPLPPPVPLAFQLQATAQTLRAVVVEERRRVYEGWLADFNRRRDMGFGRYITRSQIDARNATRASDLVRMIPGVQVSNSMRGTSLSIRGSRCQPLMWIDGSPAYAGPVDIDVFQPNSLDGIEIYSGPATVPVELRGPRGEERCGVIAIWSRMPERRPKQSKRKPVTADELNKLIASATVYTAEQVDRAVQVDSGVPVEPFYPDSMKATRTPGSAIVEFVVDPEGRVETETVSVVVASHPQFGRAARDAVWSARFVPAVLGGRPVRQVVQLPIEFKLAVRK